ncbi:MAG: hypothetical protein LBT74_00415 [Acidobacteriota bacterium]|jgi:hypothetical protein|nr:hypothetical protein [Acidobacteriota bacterium]
MRELASRWSCWAAVAAILAVGCVQAYPQGAPGGAPGNTGQGAPAAGGAPGSKVTVTTEPYNPSAAKPQQAPPAPLVQMGDKEVMLSGNLNIGVGDSVGTATGAGNFLIGYFVSDRLEVGAGLFYQIDSEITSTLTLAGEVDSQKNTSGVIGPEVLVRYNMSKPSGGSGLTYVGAEFGVQAFHASDGEGSSDKFVRPHFGYKHFLGKHRNVAFDINLGYKAIINSAPDGRKSVRWSNAVDFRLGLSYFFNKRRM